MNEQSEIEREAQKILFGYWEYYDDSYNWDDSNQLYSPDLNLTRDKFLEIGYSASEANRLIQSGYVYERLSGNIIDRYYGGLLMSSDYRTRIPLDHFGKLDRTPKSDVIVYNAKSWNEVRTIAEEQSSLAHGRSLFYRGQTNNFSIEREINNPCFVIPNIGEVSLMPSLWRRMLQKNPTSFASYRNIHVFEWKKLLDSTFDLEEIKRRRLEIAGKYIEFWTWSNFEECGDPLVEEYAKCILDINMGSHLNLAGLLSTLLQHYGLYSPVLDLTDSLDVAIFFATHHFSKTGNRSRYDFVGTNNRSSVLYILRSNKHEMQPYQMKERIIQKLQPLRPRVQNCIVCKSDQYSINLPADFLVAIIKLDFDTQVPGSSADTASLFPKEDADIFLKSLKAHPIAKSWLTDF